MGKVKAAIAKPKAYLVTKQFEDVAVRSVAIEEGYYKDLNIARGVILNDFNIELERHEDFKLTPEIENDDCIEIQVIDRARRYVFSYYITKVWG